MNYDTFILIHKALGFSLVETTMKYIGMDEADMDNIINHMNENLEVE